MNDRRTIIALILMGVVLLLTPTYMNLVGGPGGQEAAGPDTSAVTAPADTAPPRTRPAAAGEEEAEETPEPEEEAPRPPALAEPGSDAPEQGREIVVRSSRYVGKIATSSGGISSWHLPGYAMHTGGSVELIPPGARGLVLDLPRGDERALLEDLLFVSSAPDTVDVGDGEQRAVELTAGLEGGRRIRRRLTFTGGRYDLLVEDRLEGFDVSSLNDAYLLRWVGGLRLTEPDRGEELQYSGFYALQGGDVEKRKLKDELVEARLTGSVDWAALRTKYFTAVLMPGRASFRGARMTGIAPKSGPVRMDAAVEYGMEDDEELRTVVYIGPIDYSELTSYEAELQKMMDFGWGFIRPISKLILRLFTFLHEFIPNYGIVIILFSVLVKIAVFPLTRKSYASMHAMQELAPKMKELKEKYGDEPEKMNKKMMNLYKEHGVNPLGGCFPLLLQMPIFFALFVVFRSTIELRGEPFMLWIQDLSLQDPYMILPGLMALTMFIQQRMQLKDPRQKAMMYIMPLVMFFLFKGFPAGLILYWTLFNVLSVVQTEIIHPPKRAQEAGA
ncbi:MAG: membrane protein insertase YidC [bacterium]